MPVLGEIDKMDALRFVLIGVYVGLFLALILDRQAERKRKVRDFEEWLAAAPKD